MSDTKPNDGDEDDPYWITGKALERHFSIQEALLEFSRLFRDEENDRALAIVGGAFLDTLLESILTEFLIDDEKEVAELLRYDGAILVAQTREPVYNFHVRGLHNYAVGECAALVHNSCVHLNKNDAVSNFGLYEIDVNGSLSSSKFQLRFPSGVRH